MLFLKIGVLVFSFMYLVSVDPMDRSHDAEQTTNFDFCIRTSDIQMFFG